MPQDELTVADRFTLFEQMNMHQRTIDKGWGHDSAEMYNALYWPEANFNVFDLREVTFTGPDGIKQMYDYAHSVFPMNNWYHSMGAFEIHGAGDHATTGWRWTVWWKAGRAGIVSTGTYEDRFERRGGVWKCLERTSRVDPNWPVDLFQPFVDKADTAFRAS